MNPKKNHPRSLDAFSEANKPGRKRFDKRRGVQATRAQQQGVVIVMALLIVAIVAALSYSMLARLERDTRRTSLILRDTQAEFYAQGSIAWAIDQLRSNAEKAKPNQLVDLIPIKSPVNEVNGFKVESTIYDMQARFNVNSLMKPEAQVNFTRLLQLVDPKLTSEQAQAITLATKDWMTPGASQNEYASFYGELPVPYRPAHREIISISELRLVKGMTAALANNLRPFVSALPTNAAINVQTAPAVVLAVLSPTMTLEAGRAIEAIRKSKPFNTLQAFSALDVVKNHLIDSKSITILSNYFLVETIVTIEKQRLVIYTLLERTGSNGKAAMNVLWQGKGTW